MNDIFNYINNNAIVASLITLSISTIINIIFRRNDRKHEDKKENKKNRREEFINKAKLHIESKKWDSKEEPDIKVFLTDFKVDSNDNNNIEFSYREYVLNKKKYKHIQFYLKNVGNADISYLDICATNMKHNMLCGVDSVELLVKDKFINYNYLYDREILKEDVILLDIAYLEDSNICNSFSSELAILFKDSYGNLYEQPFFIKRRNLYEPFPISSEDYRLKTTVDKALECFENPWMW